MFYWHGKKDVAAAKETMFFFLLKSLSASEKQIQSSKQEVEEFELLQIKLSP
jgi:hypothetical protein